MSKCLHCGTENEQNTGFCVHCGQPLAQQQNQQNGAPPPNQGWQQAPPPPPNQEWQQAPPPPPYQQPYQQPYGQPYGQTGDTTLQLVWSIINLVICCLPLGIAALVNVLGAKNCMTKEEFDAKMKTAKICNIISLVGGILMYIIAIIYVVVMAAAAGSYSTYPF